MLQAISPDQITIFYWNSMLDFSFYRTHARMVAMEAAGLPSFLRDEHGEVMRLCNDGDVYCNITTFDWTQPHVRELWVEQVVNITQTGLADGIFADHAAVHRHLHWRPDQKPKPQPAMQRCGCWAPLLHVYGRVPRFVQLVARSGAPTTRRICWPSPPAAR